MSEPRSVKELKELVTEATGNIHVVGTAHSWSDIADTDGTHVSLVNFRKVSLDREAKKVTFGAGVTYADLIQYLTYEGLALENLPSLPHINIVGSIMTGTHGSGIHN